MNTQERRRAILTCLEGTTGPMSASALANRFGVSRQIVVGDIALLRAEGAPVLATPRGYLLTREEVGLTRVVVCRHGSDGMEAELNAMVDGGCAVLDVVVDHPVYGQISAPLQLRSRRDVEEFLRRVREADAAPLSLLTEGTHLHTLCCPDEDSFRHVSEKLAALGCLVGE